MIKLLQTTEKLFHPAVSQWLNESFSSPTDCQLEAWPAIKLRQPVLIAAPTGSGKTLAAFLAVIDDLVHTGCRNGYLEDVVHTVYVSPLKALSNDIDKNLQQPLEGIRNRLLTNGLADVDIKTAVRTGDTPQAERQRMVKAPPHILVTTPESLYLLLTSESGRAMLSSVQNVIVDEIHALAGNKRGAHLALSLERLDALLPKRALRIGLSATQKPLDRVASFLLGGVQNECRIVDGGHVKKRDLEIEMPQSPLEAVMATEVWTEVYDRLATLAQEHATTLIFVNTRRLAERASKALGERLGEEAVAAHHGSLSKEHRLHAEQRLKHGQLKILVATASMELGIDIGDVDLVCQIGSPRSIAAYLQRVGRSGHHVGGVPKGRLFPTSRDELVECVALMDAIARGELDELHVPDKPLDVLAQQITAEAASREWQTEELFACVKNAYPYRDLERSQFDQIIQMLADGFSTRRGRRAAYIHLDAVNGVISGRRGARLTALTNGGAIPEQFDYTVLLEPENLVIGTIGEDFAFESLPGDIFQLGNMSYRVQRVETGVVRVQDANGQPPSIPFWFGEAPGRTDELSQSVSRLRKTVVQSLDNGDRASANLAAELEIDESAISQMIDYLHTAYVALGELPTHERIIMERFFDDVGDMHLVIHSPYGSRVNRAWGLSLRKRFCKRFNFELQAAALEDSIVLSLGATHSFPLEEVQRYLNSESVREVLIQALLDAPMFEIRWRWVANISLAVKRNRNGKKVPPQFQRSDAEDLVAIVFPDQIACQENVSGPREIPNHPLVNQAIHDCLNDVMDIGGFEKLLRSLEASEIEIRCCDLTSPSPLAQEILSARPYAFLDDAPAEERRVRAVSGRAGSDPETAADLSRLDPAAIEKVREEVRPDARNANELHDAIFVAGLMDAAEIQTTGGKRWLDDLIEQKRVTCLNIADQTRWITAERLHEAQAFYAEANIDLVMQPEINAAGVKQPELWDAQQAGVELVRSRLEVSGPMTVLTLANHLCVAPQTIEHALLALQTEGFAMQGSFTGLTDEIEWCDRRLLARIHRYTLAKMRKEIEPVSPADFMRFLIARHGLTPDTQREGVNALADVFAQLEGYEAPVASWESTLLPSRVWGYTPSLLDELAMSGRVQWLRLTPPKLPPKSASGENKKTSGPIRITPIAFVGRRNLSHWRSLVDAADVNELKLSLSAGAVAEVLKQNGALFFEELTDVVRQLPSQVEAALAELVGAGVVGSDSFNGLRALLVPNAKRKAFSGRMRRRSSQTSSRSVEFAGRWGLVRTPVTHDFENDVQSRDDRLDVVIEALLKRYGVVFRALLANESGWLPPWRDLLKRLRRMEARGDLRGGRFVQGFTGEQFALPEAVGELREIRKRPKSEQTVVVSATDPLNLVGHILPGKKIPATLENKLLFKNGVCVAAEIAGKVELREPASGLSEWSARNALLRISPSSYSRRFN